MRSLSADFQVSPVSPFFLVILQKTLLQSRQASRQASKQRSIPLDRADSFA
jgi:hypothetical protein